MTTSTTTASKPAAASREEFLATRKPRPPASAPRVVSREAWLSARKALLAKERALTRARDALSAERRALPWVKVETPYLFDTPEGPKTLGDLFDGRSQLAVYHFMLSPDSDHVCEGCAFLADHIDGARIHFEQADLAFAAISRARLDQIEAVKKRMGWRFRWASSHGTPFNYDYGVSFTAEQVASGYVDYNYGTTNYPAPDMPGTSIFARGADGAIYHTYSTYARGGELLLGAFNWLDLAPKGRNENTIMDWVRLHDEYGKHDGHAQAAAAPAETQSPCCS
jgi:predicted dithiol-disulfide oxidoreductase (DUF899 family)